jgi:tetratricopeptide (TPR) repeat protein
METVRYLIKFVELKFYIMAKRSFILYFGLAVIFFTYSCKAKEVEKNTLTDELGTISIEVTGSEKAIVHFEEGLLLMHNFEYDDAAEAFIRAQEEDASMAMAYWGEAMTYNHPLWRQLNNVGGREVLAKLGATPEERMKKVATPFEKDLFQGAEILFGEGSKPEKDVAYRDHMEQLFHKYKGNHEVAALYALSILGAVNEGRDYEAYEKGARIAQGIIDENPNHPGALHYLIHSYDDPDNAPKALPAADSYSQVAADAGHALHMPSHIYVSMGMWDQVVDSNTDSWKASIKRKIRKNLDNDALGYHSFKWLMYGHLQRGEKEKAREMVKDMEQYCAELPSNRAKSHVVMMKGAYFSETGEWDDPLSVDTFDYSDINIQSRAVAHYNKSMRALYSDQLADVEKEMETLDEAIYAASNEVIAAASATCSGNYGNNMASQDNVNRAKVMLLELKAMVALKQGKEKEAEAHMLEAVDLEENTSFMYGPPDIVKPSSELYADWLVEKGRLEEARIQYQKVLDRAPNRLIAVKGMEKTAQSS